ATWSANPNTSNGGFTTSGAFAVDQLDAASPALAGDRIRLARIELPWRISSQPTGLTIEDLQLKSDVGQFDVRGRIDPAFAALQNSNSSSLPLGGNNDIELKGTINVARLAAMLPHALHIRQDTTVTSGSIDLSTRIQPTSAGQSFTGSIRAAQL